MSHLLVCALVSIVAGVREGSDAAELSDAIASANNDAANRQLVARLTTPFVYRPVRLRRGSAEQDHQEWALKTAIGRAERRAEVSPTRDGLRTLGIGYLLLRKRNVALDHLEHALQLETNEERVSRGIALSTDDALLADLSAAYFECATQEGRPSALIPAIAAAARAVELNAFSEAGLWNRAVALNALGARDEARAAWDAYLRVDPASEWAREARERRQSIATQRDEDLWPAAAESLRRAAMNGRAAETRDVVRRFPLRSVAFLEKQLLPAWGRAVLAGEREAAALELQIVSRVAAAISEVTGDALFSEATRSASRGVAEVYAAYGNLGYVFRGGGTAAVAAELVRLREQLRRLESPAAIRLTLALARSRYELRNHAAALDELDAMDDRSLSRYPMSRAQEQWFRGLALASLGYANQAIHSYRLAIETYRRVGESGAVGALQLMIADAAEHAGEVEEAWDSYAAAVPDVDLYGEAMIRDQTAFAVARSALRRGYPAAALVLQDSLVARLLLTQKNDVLCQALVARCESNARLGRATAARADCAAARTAFAAIGDAAARDRLQADLDMAVAVAEVSATGDVGPLTAAIEVSMRGNDHFRLPRLYLARARAHLAQQDEAAAERDLRAGIAEIEGQRSRLASDDFRVALLDSWRSIHDELVRVLIRQRRFEDAFEVADSSRARILLDRRSASNARVTIEKVRARLPAGAAFVELWSSSEGDSVAWIVRAEGTAWHGFTIRDATRRIRQCLRWLEDGGEIASADATLEALFDDIVRPWFADLGQSGTVILSPDVALSEVPFIALRDRATDRPLIASNAVVLESSAAMFLATRPSTRSWKSVVMVDNPLAHARVGELQRLSTVAERSALERAFPRVDVLEGAAATPSRFLEAAASADIVHFAGHAIDDANHDGALIMSPDAQHPDGLLSGREISNASARRGALVVLAACRTSRGRVSTEGAMSLARSFLVTGSDAVIGSLWDIDDQAAGRLFEALYRQLAAGHSVADALRNAQLEISRRHPDARHWAGFQVYGGA
jgi:CHAT domain-containing protein